MRRSGVLARVPAGAVMALLLSASLSIVAAKHEFVVATPGYETYSFSTAKLGICFTHRKDSLELLDAELGRAGVRGPYADYLDQTIAWHLGRAARFVGVVRIPTVSDTVGIDLRLSDHQMHHFAVPGTCADLLREHGISFLLILDEYQTSAGDYLAGRHVGAPAGLEETLPPEVVWDTLHSDYIAHSTWYALLDVVGRKVVQFGRAVNADHCNKLTGDDWKLSIERLFDDIVSDGPLGGPKRPKPKGAR
jgi:hypothetical protein